MNRILSGEHVDQMIEVSEEELSDVLAEATRLVRDLESPGGPVFTINQSWDTENEKYQLLIFVRRY